ATWGEVSDEIRDYSAIDLPARLDTERGRTLLSIVDPFSYRERLTQPKLILLSTNDRYWPLDALGLYWRDLPAPKHVLYVPNQGHDLRDLDRVIGALSALHRYAAAGKQLPQSTWSFEPAARTLEIRVRADRPVQRVLIWSAQNPTRDFRAARWTASACATASDEYSCSAARSEQGYTAAYAETSFLDEGNVPFSTTTTVCMLGPNEAAPLDACQPRK
ncbi:MAG: PhoPQ-activated protein PqaA family protein, partial [Steroidobacteraceae bacterium]